MPLYDVELRVTLRREADHSEDARMFAFLEVEEKLYGGVMVQDPGTPEELARASVDERAEETGITLQVRDAEKVNRPRPTPL